MPKCPTHFNCGHPRSPENSTGSCVIRKCRTCHEARTARRIADRKERDESIASAFRSGVTIADIAGRFRLSEIRVRAILDECGVSHNTPFSTDPLFPQRAIKTVASALKIEPGALSSSLRNKYLVRGRWAVWIAMAERGASLASIGRRMNRDHTSVIYGIDQGKRMVQHDPDFARLVEIARAA